MNEYEIDTDWNELCLSISADYGDELKCVFIREVEDAYKLLSVLVEFIRLKETKG